MTVPHDERAVAVIAEEKNERANNICCVCHKVITITIFKNSGVCCGNCQKIRDHDIEPWHGTISRDTSPFIETDQKIHLVDTSREPYDVRCIDCGRIHLHGEHVIWQVPTKEPGGMRTVWEGCADCWMRRSNPSVPTEEIVT